ncbi:FG-GAP-like repeat-containing protein [Planctomycetota bacterium]
MSKRISLRSCGSFELLEQRRVLSGLGFGTEETFSANSQMDAVLADIDLDGRTDVVQSFSGQGDIRWLRNTGGENDDDGDVFADGQTLLSVPGGFSATLVTDVNGDGKNDIVVASKRSTQLHWYEATGEAHPISYQEHVIPDFPTLEPTKLLLSDARPDGGRQMFAIGAAGANLFDVSSEFEFRLTDVFSTEFRDAEVSEIADVDGNGFTELYFHAIDSNDLHVVPTEPAQFGTETIAVADAYWFRLADLDGDDREELITNVRHLKTLKYGENGFEPLATPGRGFQWLAMTVADVDTDGRQEIVLLDRNEVIVLNGQTLDVETRFETSVPGLHQFTSLNDVKIQFPASGDSPDMFVWSNNSLSGYANQSGAFASLKPFREGGAVFASADFDGDGRQDPIFRNDETVGTWLSSAEFSQRTIYEQDGFGTSGHTLTDLNGDGAPDFLISVRNQLFAVLFDPSANEFLPIKEIYRSNATIGAYHVAEMNGDDLPDLLIVASRPTFRYKIDVLRQSADGSFAETQTIRNAANSSGTTIVGDFDGDGDNDLASVDESIITTLLNDGSELGEPLATVAGPVRFEAVLDVDGDGQDEILAVRGSRSESIYVLLRFDSITGEYTQTDLDLNGLSDIFQIGDFNADGRDDLRGIVDRRLLEFHGSANGLALDSVVRLDANYGYAVFTDVNHDGVITPIVNTSRDNTSYAEPTIASFGNFSTPNVIWQPHSIVPTDVWGDFDGDGKDDWAAIDSSGIYISFGGQEHQLWNVPKIDDLGEVTYALSIDTTGNQRDDLVLFGMNAIMSISVADGTTVTYPNWIGDPVELRAYDVDLDSREDLVWWSESRTSLMWSRNTRESGFAPGQELVETNQWISDFNLADLDADGDVDLAIVGDGTSVFTQLDNGSFEQTQRILPDVSMEDIVSGDLDHDGDTDLIFATPMFTGLLRRNDDGLYEFADRIGSLSTFHFNTRGALSVADIDNDGQLDVASDSEWYQYDSDVDDFVPMPGNGSLRFDQLIDVDGDGVLESFDAQNGTVSSLREIADPPPGLGTEYEPHPNNLGFPVFHAVWADINGDTVMEIVAHDGEALWHFEPVLDGWLPTKIFDDDAITTRSFPPVAATDFDQDGMDEIYLKGRVFSWIRLENGELIGNTLSGDSSVVHIESFDVDLDGDEDLIAARDRGSYAWYENTDGHPDGRTNSESGGIGFGDWLRTADFDRDGMLDSVGAERGTVTLFSAVLDLPSQRRELYNTAINDDVVPAVTDVNRDGWVDIVLAADNELKWLENSAEGFSESWETLATTNVEEASDLKVRDIDGNGTDDFVIEDSGRSLVLLNHGESFTRVELPGDRVQFKEGTAPVQILNIGLHGQLQISHFDGTSEFETTTVSQRLPVVYAAGDFDNDGRDEFLMRQHLRLSRNLVIGDGSDETKDIIVGNRLSPSVRIIDMNSDGWLDIAHFSSRKFVWSENMQGESFRQHEVEFEEQSAVTLADVDADGNVDFILRNNNEEVWFRNLGNSFAEATMLVEDPVTEWGSEIQTELDVNEDGILETLGPRRDEGINQLPASYDFDRDGSLTTGDVNLIHAAILAGSDELRFDINTDGQVSQVDGVMYVESILRSQIGDSNLDGMFSSADLVSIFQNGKYETTVHATWADGDWNFDGRFDSSDFVLAFRRSRYTG